MNRRRIFAIVCSMGLAWLMYPIGHNWWASRQWFEIQGMQRAVIIKLVAHPPNDLSESGWQNAVITLHNVWGNVTFSPEYSSLTNEEMTQLLEQLETITEETNNENAYSKADSIYDLMHSWSPKSRFIEGYRDELRDQFGPSLTR